KHPSRDLARRQSEPRRGAGLTYRLVFFDLAILADWSFRSTSRLLPRRRLDSRRWETQMPDTLRFLLILACLAGLIYGSAWGLANFPPEQTEIVKSLPHEKLRQQ